MPNLTIRLLREEHDFIRAYALRRRTSASALLADYITTLRKVTRKSRKRYHPREIAEAHCDMLKHSTGPVNDDPRTVWDFAKLVNAMLNNDRKS